MICIIFLTDLFFSGFGYQSELELRVADAVRRQYNKLKIQTKAEIRQTIDQLLVGEFIVRYHNIHYCFLMAGYLVS